MNVHQRIQAHRGDRNAFNHKRSAMKTLVLRPSPPPAPASLATATPAVATRASNPPPADPEFLAWLAELL